MISGVCGFFQRCRNGHWAPCPFCRYLSVPCVNTMEMVTFDTIIKKFEKQGEKSGWTYVLISKEQAEVLNPGVRTSYRVKGTLDRLRISQTAILPMGDGSFLLALKSELRKALGKGKGAVLAVQLEVDTAPMECDAEFLECLQDDEAALHTFRQLARGHQMYFSQWIASAKTAPTKAKRIALSVNALAKGWGYPEMIRADKAARQNAGF